MVRREKNDKETFGTRRPGDGEKEMIMPAAIHALRVIMANADSGRQKVRETEKIHS
jgi:hypothetical protein